MTIMGNKMRVWLAYTPELEVERNLAARDNSVDINDAAAQLNTTFKVPAGTQNGKEFRIPEKGVASPRGGRKGDLYVSVQVEVPVNLTSDQKELLTKFAASLNETSHPFWRSFMEKAKAFFTNRS